MFRKKITIILFLLFAPALSHAESLGSGFACVSEDLFDQLTTAAVKRDQSAINYLMSKGCIATRSGITVSVLDRTWTGVAKVRAYVNGQTIVLWTNTENINR